MDGVVAYILSRNYTKNTVIGMGAIKGAPCQVQSVNKVDKTTTITLKWEDNVGAIHTQAFNIEDGADGVSVSSATINPSGNLILTLSDGSTIDCGKVLPQYDTMPSATSSNVGQILQYIGATGGGFTNGYFYICESNGSGGYHWVEKLVQDSYTKAQIGDLTDLPDNTQNVVQNIGTLKLSIDALQASKLSISDIDNTLSTTSTNPVQNKVITEALNGKEDKFRVTVMPIITSSDVGKIVQYIGDNTSALTKGYFYIATEISTGVYDWVQKNVQPSGGGTGGDGVVDGYYNSTDHLFYEEAGYINLIAGDNNTLYVSLDTNLVYRYNGSIFIRVDESSSGEDDVIDGYYNTTDYKFYEEPSYTTEIIGETGKIYISDDTNIQYRWDGTQFVTISSSIEVDNELSTTSENPVQNKVISLAIEQLQGSVLTKIQKKLSATADDFVVFTNDGDIADSGISKDIVPATASTSNKLLVASDLSSKADKVSGATDDDIALLDSTGNLKDSNKKLSDLQSKLTEGDGININSTSNTISLDVSYLTASRVGYIPATEKGANGGVAELDSAGKIPSSQLPSYVDDVIEGYLDSGTFYEDAAHTIAITPESGKIYVDLSTDTTYRWSGTTYVQISESLALGTTHTTAYYGDYGQTAYNHSQITNGTNPHNTTADNVNLKVPIPALSGSNLDVESTLHGIDTALGTKADKVTSATNGHLAGLDANGNLTDSGVVASNVIEKVATATGLLKDDGSVDTTPYQPISLSAPISTLGGSLQNIEPILNEFNTEIKAINTDTNGKADLIDLAPAFDDTVAYNKGQYVSYNGDVYRFTANHAVGAWIGTDATKIFIANEIKNNTDDKVSYVDNTTLGAKNLLPITSTSQTVNGVVFTINDDGSITANGTATDNIIYLIHRQLTSDGDEQFFGKEVILSGCPSGGTVTTYYLECWINSSPQVWNRDFGDGVTFTMPNDNTTNWNVNISIKNGTVVNNLTFYPMVRLSTDTDDTYHPYTKTNYQLTKDISNKMTYEDNSILGAHNFNNDLKSKEFIRGTGSGTTAPDRTYGFKIGTSVKTGEQYKVAFDIKNSVDFATDNGIGARFATREAGSTALSGDVSFKHDNGHYNGILTVTGDSDVVYLYMYLSQSETDPNATLTVDNLVICLPDDIDTYTEYAMTNYQLTKAFQWKDA